MAVISITIIESAEQVISDIPRFITISTNTVSTIFYTLDGSNPTINSLIYVSPIQLPTTSKVVVSVFATNGTDSSPVIVNTYETSNLDAGARTPHSGTNALPNSTQGLNDPYPFGSSPITPGQIFTGAAEAGFTTDNPLLPEISTGFDADGNPTGFVNEALIGLPTITQPTLFTETDAEGAPVFGIGTLPRSTVQNPVAPAEQSNFSDKLFDPKALVIFQDFTKPNDPNMPVTINRQFYSQDGDDNTRDGSLYNTNIDVSAPKGTFLRQHFNPTDNTLTYYYWNSQTNRWIISKTSYTPAANAGHYYNLVFSKGQGGGFVFQWQNNKASYLY